MVVAAGDRDALPRHDPGDAGQGRSADADEVDAAEPVGGRDHVGDRDPHVAASRIIRASFSSASSGIRWAAAAPIALQPCGVGEQRDDVGRDPVGRQRRVVDQQPATGLDHRAGVERLLAVADRQRHEDRRQPDPGHLGHGVGARAAQHRVGRGVGEVHPVDVADHDVGHAGVGRLHLVRRADHVQDLDAGVGERRGRAEHGVVDRRGALRAAGDQQHRQVGPEAEDARASSRWAARSRVAIIRRIGSPTYVACRSGVSGKLVATWSVIRAPSLLATPGTVFPSWTTRGTLRVRAAR